MKTFGLLLLLSSISLADAPATAPAAKHAEIAAALAPSMPRVEIWLQFDKGEAPYGSGLTTRCPNCGSSHGEGIESLVEEERPLELPGLLLAEDRVLVQDCQVHPRFIRQVVVRHAEHSVSARVVGHFVRQNAMLLALDKLLSGAKPLDFDPRPRDAKAPGPFLSVSQVKEEVRWQTVIKPLGTVYAVAQDGEQFLSALSNGLVVNAAGKPVGVVTDERLPVDGSWKGSPLQWPAIAQEELAKRLADLEQRAGKAILHVQLSLRSPRGAGSGGGHGMGRYGGDQQGETERHALGLLTGPRTLLVLDYLKPNVTARLERITVHLPDGGTLPAKFAGSLSDYGALVATTDKDLPGAASLSALPPAALRQTMLLEAEVRLQGEKRVIYVGRRRIAGFREGWRRQVHPELPGGGNNNTWRFLFDDAGDLRVAPIARRERASSEDRYSRHDSLPTPAIYLRGVLANLPAAFDPANVPLSEEQENRLAWLGVELQALNADLARANNVSDLTSEGQSGALVTFVYPGSPAANAGLAPGTVLLRLHVKEQPKPIDIKVEPYSFADEPFPWDRYDQLPEQYFDQIPRPWPPAETELTRTLTDLGFGKSFELEFAVDGKAARKTFQIVQSPAHYDTAPRYKSEPLGLTVRAMTYEVRRYFQRKADEPGVIVSKIEAGSKASKAGLKPYEFITHVNDAALNTPADLERLVAAGGDLKLSVRRMQRGRVVKVTVDAAATTAPAKAGG